MIIQEFPFVYYGLTKMLVMKLYTKIFSISFPNHDRRKAELEKPEPISLLNWDQLVLDFTCVAQRHLPMKPFIFVRVTPACKANGK
jgi:hypothetical protein